jgi:hypothetical protein
MADKPLGNNRIDDMINDAIAKVEVHHFDPKKTQLLTARRTSKVLNTTARPAGGPNGVNTKTVEIVHSGKTSTVEFEPTALQKCCLTAAIEIVTEFYDDDPATVEMSIRQCASIIYRHMREGREL